MKVSFYYSIDVILTVADVLSPINCREK